MENYLKSVFGSNIRIDKTKVTLPLYLKEQYDVYDLYIHDKTFVLVKPKGEWPVISNIKKHISVIERMCSKRAVLMADQLTKYKRNKLIHENIQFIVPNKHIYIPYCGISLCEKYSEPIKEPSHFSPKTQLLFTALCYDKHFASCSYADIAEKLNTNKMTISRAVNELKLLGIINIVTAGNKKQIQTNKHGKELFEYGKKYLVTPVSKRVLVNNSETGNLCISGTSALSLFTMLDDNERIYALDKNKSKDLKIYPDEYVGEPDISLVELWKYDPNIFSKNHIVDFISLYAILKDSDDERIQISLEEMEEDYAW